jgi:RNA polymerase sigma factor (sigma-70 family)
MERTSLSLLESLSESSDPALWQELTELYTRWLRRWLQKSGLQEADADDLIQDVFVVINRELANFRHNGRLGAFRAWLRGILVNRLRDMLRRNDYRPTAAGGTRFLESLEQLADPRSELSQHWDLQHDRYVLHRTLERIGPRFSDSSIRAFRRIVFDHADVGDVAQELGVTRNAVIIAKCRVVKELRREVRGLLEE